MARIRTIKPEFWSDDALTECSPSARLLFIGTWNFADDSGNMDRSPKQLKARIFPLDTFDVEELVVELLENELLIEYEVDGKKYLHIKNFHKHQKIDHPSKPLFPDYDDSLRTREGSRGLNEGSLTKGKGREKEKDVKETPLSNLSARPRSDSSKAKTKKAVDLAIAIEEVFACWQMTMKHPQSKLTEDRRKLIRRWLVPGKLVKEPFTVDQLKQAIHGCSMTPHNMGHNDRNQVYDDLTVILKNVANIERFIHSSKHPPNPGSAKTASNVSVVQRFANGGRP